MEQCSQRPDALERDFELDDFKAALAFVNKVADADHALARRIDELGGG
jgi:pterin-4a-carbinolamine dehydratase